jgi:hypothetical protein
VSRAIVACAAPLPVWMQGNRVKDSRGDEACEEVVIPRGDLAPDPQGVFAGGLSEQVIDPARVVFANAEERPFGPP